MTAAAPSASFQQALSRLCTALDAHHSDSLEESLLDRVRHRYRIQDDGLRLSAPAARLPTTTCKASGTLGRAHRAHRDAQQKQTARPERPGELAHLAVRNAHPHAPAPATKPRRWRAVVKDISVKVRCATQSPSQSHRRLPHRPPFDASTCAASSLTASALRLTTPRRRLQQAAHQALVDATHSCGLDALSDTTSKGRGHAVVGHGHTQVGFRRGV